MEIYKNIVSIVSIVFKPFRKQELIYSSRYALVVFWTLIIINDPLIIINTRYARNIDVHTPQSAWAPTERKNVQLMAINV